MGGVLFLKNVKKTVILLSLISGSQPRGLRKLTVQPNDDSKVPKLIKYININILK